MNHAFSEEHLNSLVDLIHTFFNSKQEILERTLSEVNQDRAEALKALRTLFEEVAPDGYLNAMGCTEGETNFCEFGDEGDAELVGYYCEYHQLLLDAQKVLKKWQK